MIIYFLRHASAGETYSDPVKDLKRPLDDEGILQSRYIGQTLAALDVHPEVIISSPLTRAMQTASIVANELSYEQKIESDKRLRPEAGFAEFQQLVNAHGKAESIMVVGHNPSLNEFAAQVIGASAKSGIALKKGAVAKIEIARRGRGNLQWCITPKIVRTLQELFSKSSRPKTSGK